MADLDLKKSPDVEEFNRRSGQYERSILTPFFDWFHRIVLKQVPLEFMPGEILDIGCGAGRLLRKAASRWPAARFIGVDPAEGMIHQARWLTPGPTFYLGQAEAIPLPDESVDLVLSTMSFHHWQDQGAGLRQIARVLHPGGQFVLADVFLPYHLSRVIHHGRIANEPLLRDLFAQAGLKTQSQRKYLARFILVTVSERL